MSSRTSGRMGLRGLVLGGAVAVSTLQSCAFLGALVVADHHAHVVARGGGKSSTNTAPQLPTDRKLSHSELMEMLRAQGASPEKIVEVKLGNVAYDPLFGYTMSPMCNYGKDLNNNDKVEGPEELFGLDSQLIEGDPILLGMGCEKEQKELTYRLFDSCGNKIDELMSKRNSVIVAYNHSELLKYPERDEPVRREIKLSYGRYLATLHSGTNLITSREFTIVPKQQGTVVANKKNN